MTPDDLQLIREIDLLWEPVYPYLARHIRELYARRDGRILEIGPFSGSLFALMKEGMGDSYTIASFPPGMAEFFRDQARRQKSDGAVAVLESDPALTGVQDKSIDLAIFRGALFFPSLFEVNFRAIRRVLSPDGLAVIGGGFGKYTPDQVIEKIANRSRDLNLAIGKIGVSEEMVRQQVLKSEVGQNVEVVSDGGLWLLMRA